MPKRTPARDILNDEGVVTDVINLAPNSDCVALNIP